MKYRMTPTESKSKSVKQKHITFIKVEDTSCKSGVSSIIFDFCGRIWDFWDKKRGKNPGVDERG